MRYGVFLPTANNGYVPSLLVPDTEATYADNLAITRQAEAIGLDFALAMVKFRGPGGDSDYWNGALEAMTLSAGLLAATERIRVVGSVGILSIHPAVAARMAVTNDSIGPGRFGLNIVTGWNALEYSQMGLWPGDEYFGYRYEYAREYVQVLRELWATGRSDFSGRFFRLDDCHGKRLIDSHIDIVCAGGSPAGRAFAAEVGDVNFVSSTGMDEAVRDLRARAASVGRSVETNVLQMVVLADTDERAWERVRAYNAQTDERALGGRRAAASRDASTGGTAERGRAMATAIDESTVIAGSAATVARRLHAIARTGLVDGISLQFDDCHDGLSRFGDAELPRRAPESNEA